MTAPPPAHAPTFLIVGAAKCGTTSLAEFLRQHPEVFVPELKELSFFSAPDARRTKSFEDYLRHFEGAARFRARGEASVNYLYDPEAPRRIAETLGRDVQIVVILRNPVSMAYSLWGHNRRLVREPLEFRDALAREDARAEGADELIGWRPDFLYRRRATYTPQVASYLEVFGRARVRVLLFEEVVADPATVLTELCLWLGVSAPARPEFPRLNVAGTARSKRLRRWLDGRSWGKRLLKGALPGALRLRARRWIDRVNRVEQPLAKLEATERALLEGSFRSDVRALAELLGRDLSIWGAIAAPD